MHPSSLLNPRTLPNHCGRLKRSQYHPQSHIFLIGSPSLPFPPAPYLKACSTSPCGDHIPEPQRKTTTCFCCHWVLVVGFSDLFPHLDAHRVPPSTTHHIQPPVEACGQPSTLLEKCMFCTNPGSTLEYLQPGSSVVRAPGYIQEVLGSNPGLVIFSCNCALPKQQGV